MTVQGLLGAGLLFVGGVLAASGIGGIRNGLARTPQMGWNNWNAFACDVSEDLLLETAQHMVNFGLRDAGYHYVVLDDCWSAGRSENGSLIANSTRFPRGMRDVADRIHDLGMGFGMYSSAGSLTCARYEASLGYEDIDAQTFASWGVDYLKYDNCFNEGQEGTPFLTYNRYKRMSDALNATGRPILYSMCNWGQDRPWQWAGTIANSWRMSGDITDNFNRVDPRCPCPGDEGHECTYAGFHCSAMNILNKVASFPDRGMPGAWNDLDMLEVGNGGMTDTEYVTHFTMWAAVKSPLIMGTDIRALDARSLSIFTNPAVLAISQDPSGSSAVRRWRYYLPSNDVSGNATAAQGNGPGSEIQMWSGSLAGGDYFVGLLNLGEEAMTMNATLADIFVDDGGSHSEEAQSSWDVYDLWANRMPDSVANAIIGANSTSAANTTGLYWNATAQSFGDGVADGEPVLLGTRVGTVEAGGQISSMVPSHGIYAVRLRLREGPSKRKRDEL